MRTFLTTAWTGGYPLWLTYWVIGVGGNMAFLGLMGAIWLVAAGLPVPLTGAEVPAGPVMAGIWTVWGVSVAWHGFTFRATWAAGRRYTGPRLWVWLARAAFTLGYPRLALEAAFLGGAFF